MSFTAAVPTWFQLLGGLGDIAAGIGAFLAISYYGRHRNNERKAIIRGNFTGILDFLIVLNLGVMVVLPGAESADNAFNLIPFYAVPIFILLHIFSLQRLSRNPIAKTKEVTSA